MQSNPNFAFWFLLASAVAATAAGFSAWAAVSMRNLTKELIDVTKHYAETVRQQLILLQRGAEPRLFLDATLLVSYPYSQCAVTCIHLGPTSSHPVFIEQVETALESVEVPGEILTSETAQFRDVLHPGKRWFKVVTSRFGERLASLPRPNIVQAIRRWKWERRVIAYLAIRLVYSVAGEQKPPVEKQFQVIATPAGEALKAVG